MEEQTQEIKAIEPKPQKPDFLDLAQYKPQPVDDPNSHGLEFVEYTPD